jgi:uncharacterized protein with von Willebrand factor type A (vWA) domain
MKYFYGEFDGEEFPTPGLALRLRPDHELHPAVRRPCHEGHAADDGQAKDGEVSDLLEQMLKDGMLDKDGKGKLRLTPKAVGKMQSRALMEVFKNLEERPARRATKRSPPAPTVERIEGTKAYQFGDPISELDLRTHPSQRMARTARERA